MTELFGDRSEWHTTEFVTLPEGTPRLITQSDYDTLQTQLEAQTALIIQMREALVEARGCIVHLNGENYTGTLGRIDAAYHATPSQAETALRNKHYQECIEKLCEEERITCNLMEQAKESGDHWQRYALIQSTIKSSISALQALIKKED